MASPALPCLAAGRGGEVYLDVLIAPRASSNRLMGLHDGRLKLGVTAPPVDGRANELVAEYIADVLKTSRRNVTIVSGQTSKRKRLAITAVPLDRCAELITAQLG